jgi:hypothetical protein
MEARALSRIEPSQDVLAASRKWLEPVRAALDRDFLAAYLTGSVLTQGFDAKHSEINMLIVARLLAPETLDALVGALPDVKKPPRFAPLFMTERQIEKSLDSFPIEWIEIQEQHLLIEGQDTLRNLQVPRTYLRLQCEHELRAKLILLRQTYVLSGARPDRLETALRSTASGFATLFRTLLRLAGESPPADTAQVIERVADVHQLQAEGLLGVYLVRANPRRYRGHELLPIYRKFLAEIERLVSIIDGMPVT